MLLSELPEEIRKLERFCVNAEKDTNVVTRIVQRWRSLSNPISNTIGGTEGTDFLIAAPYADKLPLKVADYIRRDTPFAILIPLSLLNEIERIGKNEIDNHIREKRSRMKLVISSSLGQAWLITTQTVASKNLHIPFSSLKSRITILYKTLQTPCSVRGISKTSDQLIQRSLAQTCPPMILIYWWWMPSIDS